MALQTYSSLASALAGQRCVCTTQKGTPKAASLFPNDQCGGSEHVQHNIAVVVRTDLQPQSRLAASAVLPVKSAGRLVQTACQCNYLKVNACLLLLLADMGPDFVTSKDVVFAGSLLQAPIASPACWQVHGWQ